MGGVFITLCTLWAGVYHKSINNLTSANGGNT